MKKTLRKTLQLNRERLRCLSPTQLGEARGGEVATISQDTSVDIPCDTDVCPFPVL